MTRKELILSDEWIEEHVENILWANKGRGRGHNERDLTKFIKDYRDEIVSLGISVSVKEYAVEVLEGLKAKVTDNAFASKARQFDCHWSAVRVYEAEELAFRSALSLIESTITQIKSNPSGNIGIHDENGLLPCPFCGGKAELETRLFKSGVNRIRTSVGYLENMGNQMSKSYYVKCSNPLCLIKAGTGYWSTKEEAMNIWNTRGSAGHPQRPPSPDSK